MAAPNDATCRLQYSEPVWNLSRPIPVIIILMYRCTCLLRPWQLLHTYTQTHCVNNSVTLSLTLTLREYVTAVRYTRRQLLLSHITICVYETDDSAGLSPSHMLKWNWNKTLKHSPKQFWSCSSLISISLLSGQNLGTSVNRILQEKQKTFQLTSY